MKLLGVYIGKYDDDGQYWSSTIRDWFEDRSWDIFDTTKQHRDTLEKFQEIADRAGCTNIEQVEYIFQLEQRLDSLEKVVRQLSSIHV